MAYKVEADVPLTLHIIIPIFILALWSGSKSKSRFDTSVSILSPSLNFTWPSGCAFAGDLMTCTHSPYWISHPASSYTPILIYFSVQGISLSLSPSHCHSVCLSICLCLSLYLFLLNYLCTVVVWVWLDGKSILQEGEQFVETRLWPWKTNAAFEFIAGLYNSWMTPLIEDDCQNNLFTVNNILMYCSLYSVLSSVALWQDV